MNKSELYTLFFNFIGEEIPSVSDRSWNLFALLQHQEKWEIINKFMKCAELRLSQAHSLPSRVVASYPVGPVSAEYFITRQLLTVETRNHYDSVAERWRPGDRLSTQWEIIFYFKCTFL